MLDPPRHRTLYPIPEPRSVSSQPVDEPLIPSYRDLLYPTLEALDVLGGSGTKDEVDTQVITALGLTDEQLGVEYPPDAVAKGSKVLHRLAFARSSMKLADAVDNSTRGVWSLLPLGRDLLPKGDAAAREADTDMRRRLRALRLERKKRADEQDAVEEFDPAELDDSSSDTSDESVSTWTGDLLEVLTQMSPAAFERLSGRLLREVGFARVEVLGRSDDGGIDGSGLLEVQLLSFPIYFQCKKYTGTVGPDKIRDFRGAMVGRGDKGLFITTGTFTPAARAEAQRAGAPPIDLIDGARLCDLLKQHRLGVNVEVVEQMTVDPAFFSTF